MNLHELMERVGEVATGRASLMFAFGSAVLLMSACAGTPPGAEGSGSRELASNEVIVCEDVVTTGTRFAKRVCWTETQRDTQRESAERIISGARENSTIGDVQSGPGTFGPPVPANQ